MNVSIQIAQMEVKVGNIKANTEKIKEIINNSSSKFIVFPELAITGYTAGNLFLNEAFIKEADEALQDIIDSIKDNQIIILGSIQKLDNLYNTAFILNTNGIIGTYFKIHLASTFQHEDGHYFTAGTKIKTFNIEGIKFAPMICEDAWNEDRDLYLELKKENVDLVFSLNCSYSSFTKVNIRKDLYKNKKHIIPTIYVNNIGVGDSVKNIIIYDGNSMIIDKNDIKVLDSFKEENYTLFFNNRTKDFYFTGNRDFSLNLFNEKKIILQMIIYGIKKSFELAGVKKAQVHMSGGIDSSVVGYLAVKALGSENCIFISQPSKNNGDATKNNAQIESDKLGVPLIWQPIQEYIDIYKRENPEATPLEIATFEATQRTALGLAQAHKYGSAILSCGNHTENALGFFTFHDIGSIGLLQPIGDLTKREVLDLAKYINFNENKNIIPKCLYDGSLKPSAELEDNKGDDPYDYDIMSVICSEIIRENNWNEEIIISKIIDSCGMFEDVAKELFGEYKTINKTREEVIEYIALAKKLIIINAFKRAQSAPVLILSDGFSFGFSMRDPLINGWMG